MTRIEALAVMANLAGFDVALTRGGMPTLDDSLREQLEKFAVMVVKAERERCAQACEAWGHECHGEGRDDSEAFDCADLIRALKDGDE